MMTERQGPAIRALRAEAFRIPTDTPEADGTLSWESTTLVLVRLEAGGETGLGYTYADAAVVPLLLGLIAHTLQGRNCFDIPVCWNAMQRAVRNLGRSGLAACAISAVDAALWDLKARHLKLALASLLGREREVVPVYGSGGFTNYTDEQLQRQLSDWVSRDGCHFVKMKIGSEPERDPERVAAARAAIGERELFVDANGAYSVKQALLLCGAFERAQVRWFEEPVTSDDPAGLRMMRMRAPTGIDIAAGEYVYTLDDARRLLEPRAVDVLQADVTRCGGITGFLKIAALCEAHHVALSGHCAPSLHRHVACAVPRVRHLEWFHDHVRIEQTLFEGAPRAANGMIRPDLGRPGHGLEFKSRDAERFSVSGGESR
jgi:L-alanine-DL-glutamate epimerase-like enolase superfamily enzyme